MIYHSSDIYKLLKHSAINDDCATFKRYWGREITLAETLAEFRVNNKVSSDAEIPLEEFEKWLKGLGWYDG